MMFLLAGGFQIGKSKSKKFGFGRDCLTGFKPEKGECAECETGFTGLSCEIKCPYPSYGIQCRQLCNCSEIFCNFSYGCNDTLGEYSTSPQNYSAVQHNVKTSANISLENANARDKLEIEIGDNGTETSWGLLCALGLVGFFFLFFLTLNILFRTSHGVKLCSSVINM
ncbi:multiple epidermal growth factor-like domains protein 10 [Saccostrea cucullata]|uniref:multiple epidermal growth factor-like domains protein 10 n=1 Tax=Saccostrea cuccullata TaxID=36930 RepID=UPI002ECFD4D3